MVNIQQLIPNLPSGKIEIVSWGVELRPRVFFFSIGVKDKGHGGEIKIGIHRGTRGLVVCCLPWSSKVEERSKS